MSSSPRPRPLFALRFGQSDFPVDVQAPGADRVSDPGVAGRTMRVLWQQGKTQRDAAVEFQRRISFPFACVAFALLAMPIGARPRRGGRAAGFLITLLLISGYYLLFTIGAEFARQGSIPVWIGIWTPNVITAALGLFLLPRLERMPGSSRTSALFDRIAAWRLWKIFSREDNVVPAANRRMASLTGKLFCARKIGRAGIPQLLDLYMLRSFSLYYFVCC